MHINNHISENSFLQAVSEIKNTTTISVMEFLFRLHKKYPAFLIPSQTRVALSCGIVRETANRHIAKLCALGFLEKKKRYNQTSVYKINPLFFKYHAQLSKIFSNLSYFSLTLSMLVSQSTITSIRKLNIYISPLYSISRNSKEGVRENDTGRGRIFIKTREVMQEVVITPTMRKVTDELGLTKWGQIKLVIFRDHVLSYALNEFRKNKNIANPFDWFFTTARRYSERENISPDWPSYYNLCKKYNMPDNPTFILKKPLVEKPKAPFSPYAPYKMPEKESLEERVKNLKRDIANYVKIFADPSPFVMPEMITWAENLCKARIEELNEIQRDNPELIL